MLIGLLVGAGTNEMPPEALIVAIERAHPLTVDKVERLLGVALTCRDGSCEGLRNGVRVDFRHGPSRSLLLLEPFPDPCIPLDRLRSLYPSGRISMECADAICFYDKVARPWGTLSFKVSDGSDAAWCATSVVFSVP